MKSMLIRFHRRRDERGMTTSEYAVGTVGACGVAGVLYELANSGFFQKLLTDVISGIWDLLPF
jgi:Flp pilus assembly pilin Flp